MVQPSTARLVTEASLSSALASQRGATGSRPAAGSVAVGAFFYDVTLKKPIWSDGTTWRDAAGTAV